jgi:hypothetical protein
MMNTEDPLPLRTARINNEAAIKRSQKSMEISRNAAVAAEETKCNSHIAREHAIQSKNKALEAANALDDVIPEAQQAFSELRLILEEMTKKHRESTGLLFYIEREIQEAEQFLPRRGPSAQVGNKSILPVNDASSSSMNALPLKVTT